MPIDNFFAVLCGDCVTRETRQEHVGIRGKFIAQCGMKVT